MGYMVHHAIIVTSWSNDDKIEIARTMAEGLGLPVTDIIDGNVNSYRTFLVGPDGSKAGWEESNLGDRSRDIFIDWMTQNRVGLEWAEVQYADENGDNKITRHHETY